MDYKQYYDMVIDMFKNSIKTTDKKLFNKILNTLLNWYKNNYETDLIKYFNDKNELSIEFVSKELKKICSLSDYEKIQKAYQCEELTELTNLSDEIFAMVKNVVMKQNITFDESDYNKFINRLKRLELVFPKIVFNKFEFLNSECLLDLNYLLKKGQVENYSLRTYQFLKNNKLL